MGKRIGLDIGTTGVRAVESSASARSISVTKAHALPLGEDVFIDGELNNPAALVDHLRQLWKKAKFSTKDVHLVVGSHPAVLVRSATFPFVPSKPDMDKIVEAEADRVLPAAMDQYYLDHHTAAVHTEVAEDDTVTHKAQAAVAAARRDFLDNILTAVTDAGLTPRSVDVTIFALARLISQASSGPSHLDGLVHIGASTVTITALSEGQFTYQRVANEFASQTLTQELSEAMGITEAEAERAKHAAAQQNPGHLGGADASPMVAQWTTALVEEITEAITQATQAAAKPAGRVWLTGAGARLPELSARLEVHLPAGTRVAPLDPTAWVRNPDKLAAAGAKDGQDLTVALAASARPKGGKTK